MASPVTEDDSFLTRFLQYNRGLLENLRLDHVDVGGYCKVCGGPQSGRHRYPCQIRDAIDKADRAIADEEAPEGHNGSRTF